MKIASHECECVHCRRRMGAGSPIDVAFSAETVAQEMEGAAATGDGTWIVKSALGPDYILGCDEISAVMDLFGSEGFDPGVHTKLWWEEEDLEADGTCPPRFA